MLNAARERVTQELTGHPAPEIRGALEREGVKVSLDNLRTFPCINILEDKGRVALHGAHFDIATGTLAVLNQATGKFVAM